MDDAFLVRRLHRLGQLPHDHRHGTRRELLPGADEPRQCLALQVRHRQIEDSLHLAAVVDRTQIRVRQLRRDVGLAQEAIL